jgi:hypothetical protein
MSSIADLKKAFEPPAADEPAKPSPNATRPPGAVKKLNSFKHLDKNAGTMSLGG